jgi:predicted ester cyclase
MTSIREPSIDVPATSDELVEQRHLETNKEVAREVIDRIFVRGEDAAIDELIAADFQPYTFGPMPPGRDGLREGMRRAHSGVSDSEFTIHDMIAENDRVAVRLTTSARHTGPFMGMAPTGRRYSIDEIHIFGIRNGQVVDHWHAFDRADLMRQLQGEEGEDDRHRPASYGGHGSRRENRDEWDIE